MEWHIRILVIFLQIFLSVHFLAFAFEKKRYYVLKLILSTLAFLALTLALPEPTFDSVMLNALINTLIYFLAVIESYVGLRLCYKAKNNDLLFVLISGYTIQHIIYTIFIMIDHLAMQSQAFASSYYGQHIYIRRACITPLFIPVLYYPYRFVRNNKEEQLSSRSTLVIAFLALFSDITLSLFISDNMDLATYESMKLLNLLCCLLIIYVLFYLKKKIRIEKDLSVMENLIVKQGEQYEINKESKMLLDIKCHDLKQQIHQHTSNIDEQALREMDDIINRYQSEYKTGRESLDIVLQEKSMLCNRYGIELNALIDTKSVEFMSDSDIYSLFGNILDNAIEAVSKIEDKDRRIIYLRVKNVSNLTIIKESNRYVGNLSYDKNDIPLTTKNDISNHGYGLKSIRYTTEKYNGQMKIGTDGDEFTLTLTFVEE